MKKVKLVIEDDSTDKLNFIEIILDEQYDLDSKKLNDNERNTLLGLVNKIKLN